MIGGPVSIGSPAQSDADGFTVLPNGNYLINDFDGGNGGEGAAIYREYDAATGQLASGGLVIDLSSLGYSLATGVATAPDGQSLYFLADGHTVVQTDLAGHWLASQYLGDTGLDGEDIEIVLKQP